MLEFSSKGISPTLTGMLSRSLPPSPLFALLQLTLTQTWEGFSQRGWGAFLLPLPLSTSSS